MKSAVTNSRISGQTPSAKAAAGLTTIPRVNIHGFKPRLRRKIRTRPLIRATKVTLSAQLIALVRHGRGVEMVETSVVACHVDVNVLAGGGAEMISRSVLVSTATFICLDGLERSYRSLFALAFSSST